MKWDENLLGVAREIAATDNSPLRVLAGPGTGKTYALKRRVARLLQEGVAPERILVCSFTRTAAGDLKKELQDMKVAGIDKVSATTLHAFSYSLLSRDNVLPLTGRTPRPLLEFEEKFLLCDLNHQDFGTIPQRSARLKAFNAAWARLDDEEAGWCKEQTDKLFESSLKTWLLFHEAMLIGELIPESLKYLRTNPALEVHKEFDHVLVDEYQDLNKAEQELLNLISKSASMAIIGDEDQSIYSFKYAHPEGIANFGTSSLTKVDYSLEECRRCPTLVVEMANELISNNTFRAARSLKSFDGKPVGEVKVVQWQSLEEETNGVATYIQAQVEKGAVEPGKILVLAPRRFIGYEIRDALKTLDVPAHSFFNEEELDGNPKEKSRHDVQEAFTLISLLDNPDDRVALRCWVGFGHNELRAKEWAYLKDHCENNNFTPRDLLDKLASKAVEPIKKTAPLVKRYELLKEKLNNLESLKGNSLLNAVFPCEQDWAQEIRSVISTAKLSEDFDATSLVNCIRERVIQPELPSETDYVRVMSLHKSKGLTADLVIVLGCIQGLIPKIEDPSLVNFPLKSLEEQRRLFYVAITRPTRALILSSVLKLPRKQAYTMGIKANAGKSLYVNTQASMFLSELGPSSPTAISGAKWLEELI
jgi:DNA helicase II / ATP-dependent DNA helicase PcrA